MVFLEDARLHGCEHLLCGRRDGAVTKGLERQDGEGLLTRVRVEGGAWRVEGGGWRVEGERVEGAHVLTY